MSFVKPRPDRSDGSFWDSPGAAIGSDRRYEPTWWFTRRAYMAGLRDAARIVNDRSYKAIDPTPTSSATRGRAVSGIWIKNVISEIHERYLSLADKK